MPGPTMTLNTVTEKPHHYTYLKEFRTQQCPLFLQHKCTQHRPYTCFHWHFMNQRRRRPVRKRDGNFNYSPDAYCTKYDETTGACPDRDECSLLHRTAGDTERRYHLRYYKTGTCVHDTDAKGCCMKNGAHCAFAHGAHDLRSPVYDLRELTAIEQGDIVLGLGGMMGGPEVANGCSPILSVSGSLERDRFLNDDPKWNDTSYVLSHYKTEQCKRPPRLCRQGYACPQFHNNRDRRRNPRNHKYRSTPCPNVKHSDEWSDPSNCDSGDACAYCHTRTEQQFHPEIYKSTKCNDMVQTGYCPRGPFCAFAHVENEMSINSREMSAAGSSLAAYLPEDLQEDNKEDANGDGGLFRERNNNMSEAKDIINPNISSNHGPIGGGRGGNHLVSSSPFVSQHHMQYQGMGHAAYGSSLDELQLPVSSMGFSGPDSPTRYTASSMMGGVHSSPMNSLEQHHQLQQQRRLMMQQQHQGGAHPIGSPPGSHHHAIGSPAGSNPLTVHHLGSPGGGGSKAMSIHRHRGSNPLSSPTGLSSANPLNMMMGSPPNHLMSGSGGGLDGHSAFMRGLGSPPGSSRSSLLMHSQSVDSSSMIGLPPSSLELPAGGPSSASALSYSNSFFSSYEGESGLGNKREVPSTSTVQSVIGALELADKEEQELDCEEEEEVSVGGSSLGMNIIGGLGGPGDNLSTLSQSPLSSSLGSSSQSHFFNSAGGLRDFNMDQTQAAFMGHPSGGRYSTRSASVGSGSELNPKYSPRLLPHLSVHQQVQAAATAPVVKAGFRFPTRNGGGGGDMFDSSGVLGVTGNGSGSMGGSGFIAAQGIGAGFSAAGGVGGEEMVKLRTELTTAKTKLLSWEEGINQARSACDAWKKQSAAANLKRDEVLKELTVRREMDKYMHCMAKDSELETASVRHLAQMKQSLEDDLARVSQMLAKKNATHLQPLPPVTTSAM